MEKGERILLDTSVQIGKFKYSEIQDHIKKRSEDMKVYSSFYVLFEFKVGLIQSLIDFWNEVNAREDVSKAITAWSEKFSVRDLKNFLLIQAILTEKFKTIPNSKAKYLRRIEFVIFHLLTNFFSNGIERYLMGDFRNDDIVRYEILSSDDFAGFIALCRAKKSMADLESFWKKHLQPLELFLGSKDLKKSYSKVYEALERVKADIANANKVNTNRRLGDTVITTDAREGMEIISTDESFALLTKILSKPSEIIPHSY